MQQLQTETFRHALGNRAKKAGQGILTVRFEMPFAIWCTTCPQETIIGQGVRFNAEKKMVGNYYSTPIYSFRMKHTACGGWIEIRTDPKNTAYLVIEGAKKRDYAEDKVVEGDLQLRTEEEKDRLRNDAFAALEVTIDDKRQATADKRRINDLFEATERDWEDPYAANQKLRKEFRVVRKKREKDHIARESLKDRMSLGMELLDETEEDRRRASLVDFGEREDASVQRLVRDVQAKGLFHSPKHAFGRKAKPDGSLKLKAVLAIEKSKDQLRQELGQNTRTALDPFLSSKPVIFRSVFGVKRKRATGETGQDNDRAESNQDDTKAGGLVEYDSD